jgi:hypothetical protein
MSETELYEMARGRIDRRNRRWVFWAVDLAGLVLSLGALILLSKSAYVTIAAAVFLSWGGVFTLHTILAALAHNRDQDIEGEMDKLRALVYEKPKRTEVGEDGELIEQDLWESEPERENRLS